MPDRTLSCADCGQDFAFTEAEQAFFAERGFTNDPKRCVECRRRRRKRSRPEADRSTPRGGATARTAEGFAESASHTPKRPDQKMYEALCTLCNAATDVPFRPDGVRPVFCLPCLKTQTR